VDLIGLAASIAIALAAGVGITIFVTGGAGFIGSAVVRHLLRETKARVVNIDKLTYAANLDSLPGAVGHPRYAFAQACICEGPALRKQSAHR